MEEVPEILGVPEMDAGHQKIAELLDALHVIVTDGADAALILAIITELVDVFCDQIVYEEDVMRSLLPNEAEAHRRNHDEFFRMTSMLIVKYQTNNLRITDDTAAMIKAWTFEHIRTFDRPLAEAILRQGQRG